MVWFIDNQTRESLHPCWTLPPCFRAAIGNVFQEDVGVTGSVEAGGGRLYEAHYGFRNRIPVSMAILECIDKGFKVRANVVPPRGESFVRRSAGDQR